MIAYPAARGMKGTKRGEEGGRGAHDRWTLHG
jgi:hypothetical protein